MTNDRAQSLSIPYLHVGGLRPGGDHLHLGGQSSNGNRRATLDAAARRQILAVDFRQCFGLVMFGNEWQKRQLERISDSNGRLCGPFGGVFSGNNNRP